MPPGGDAHSVIKSHKGDDDDKGIRKFDGTDVSKFEEWQIWATSFLPKIRSSNTFLQTPHQNMRSTQEEACSWVLIATRQAGQPNLRQIRRPAQAHALDPAPGARIHRIRVFSHIAVLPETSHYLIERGPAAVSRLHLLDRHDVGLVEPYRVHDVVQSLPPQRALHRAAIRQVLQIPLHEPNVSALGITRWVFAYVPFKESILDLELLYLQSQSFDLFRVQFGSLHGSILS